MIETYTGEFKIKNEVGKNLLETYEVNGRKYTDNIPSDFIIGISKKEFIEYQQQKKEIERLNKQLQLISDEFLKYDWENSSKKQIINQLKSLYNSIFKGSDKE